MAGPQKAVFPPDIGEFQSAFVETGNTAVARSVAHIVSVDEGSGLMVYVQRKDGQPAGISYVETRGGRVPVLRVSWGDAAPGVLLIQSDAEQRQHALDGFLASLCSELECYPISVPATLYQQAIFE